MTLTTEQLRARAESLGLDFFIERRAGIWVKEWLNDGCTSATDEEVMMWSMLANLEAQPVAWRHDNGPFAGMAITRAKSVADSWIAKGWTVTPLYTAPPAPAVVKLPRAFFSDKGVMIPLEKVMAALAFCGIEYEKSPMPTEVADMERQILVNGRTAEGWMAEALLQKKVAEDLRESALAVPEEIPEVDRGEGGSDIDYMAPQEIYDMGKTDGWNACRAAMLNHVGDTNEKAAAKCECSSIDYCGDCLRGMLAQPVSQGYTLPEGGNDHDTRR